VVDIIENNSEIIETLFDEQILNLLGSTKLTPIDCLLANMNSPCIIVKKNNTIVAMSLISSSNGHDIDEFFKIHQCCGDYAWCKEHIVPFLREKSIWLNTVETYKKGNGYGTNIVKHLKTKYESIYLTSTIESQMYWQKMNFTPVGGGIYVWSETVKLV